MAVPTAQPRVPDPAAKPPAVPARARSVVTALLRIVAATGGGVLLYLAFPPRPTWFLAIPAFALLRLVLDGRRPRAAFGYGFLFSMGVFVPLLHWVSTLVQTLPWIALAVFESLFMAVAAVGMALVARVRFTPVVLMACVWIAGEAVRSRVPFGGMPWGRVGFSQPDGPLVPLAAIGGEPLLSFITVLAGLALGELVRRALAGQRQPRSLGGPALLTAAAVASGPLAGLVPPTGPVGPTVTIAAIQGNVPRLGLDFNAQRRAVLDNHVRQTEALAADVAAGKVPEPDIVIWPENSSDIDPLLNADAAAQIDRAARAIGVPILVGAVLRNPDGVTTSNSALVWEAGVGVVERNDKRRIQPFGEYMPWREFFRLFSPYVDRAGYFVPGTGTGRVTMAGIAVGVAICWEVAFDDAVQDEIDAGAQVFAVPSNNATFGLSEMTYQQLAISQVRSVEHDRTSIIATTSGVSATIDPDGTVTQATGQFEAGYLVHETVLRDTTTLASRLRGVPEWTLAALGVLAVGAALWTGRARRTAPGEGDAGTAGNGKTGAE
ncbi:Apolipoprotein N-acyltransferase [Pseudonocardia thermophila]|uniref:Apolipoprotein N-acyltransferase n=1 Tax=Pseudonocardia thermophila TaxID=1848 RepID=A0A1M6N7R9_PSETH|nr:apolipoprotein N-acyltransferase [Pseudonocardia thermophila]SHJ91674.1 Apolipoprotein N-acyltransferase [Pseudonocardia thermophila]